MAAISSAASSLRSSISPSPASSKALESSSAAWESPAEEMMAARLNCSACAHNRGQRSIIQHVHKGQRSITVYKGQRSITACKQRPQDMNMQTIIALSKQKDIGDQLRLLRQMPQVQHFRPKQVGRKSVSSSAHHRSHLLSYR